jgi:hypothetical protein
VRADFFDLLLAERDFPEVIVVLKVARNTPKRSGLCPFDLVDDPIPVKKYQRRLFPEVPIVPFALEEEDLKAALMKRLGLSSI